MASETVKKGRAGVPRKGGWGKPWDSKKRRGIKKDSVPNKRAGIP